MSIPLIIRLENHPIPSDCKPADWRRDLRLDLYQCLVDQRYRFREFEPVVFVLGEVYEQNGGNPTIAVITFENLSTPSCGWSSDDVAERGAFMKAFQQTLRRHLPAEQNWIITVIDRQDGGRTLTFFPPS